MKLAWHFSKVNPRFKNREATQGEFFASDTQIRAFIREAVQNSLDAKRPDLQGPVSIRIFVSGDRAALTPETAKRYFRGGWDHFLASDSGLKDAPSRADSCRFITFEDSGTTGLTGDTEQYHEVPGVRNPFYYFFRAEGQSNKQESGRGRWGLGKFVFPRSSRIRSFFAVTVRHDDRKRFLVGQSILRSHHVEDRNYTPDGWFGEKPEKDEPAPPVSDQEFIGQFEEDFCLERKRDPGLSIVVPFCDEAWTIGAILETVLQDYFYVILRDELIVTIEDPDTEYVLNSQTLPGIIEASDEHVRSSVGPLLRLTQWGFDQQSAGALLTLSCDAGKTGLRWTRKTIVPTEFSAVRRALQEYQKAVVRIPVVVQHRTGATRNGHFDIFLEQAEGSTQKRPVFFRDGILIADVRTRLVRDLRSIVAIDSPALTEFLGDAENPAHTEWSEETSHFRGKYTNGAHLLRFVRNTVADLWQLLTEAGEEDDQEVLVDVFSVGTNEGQPGLPVDFESSTTTQPRSIGKERLKSLTAKRRTGRAWRMTRRAGGFRIQGTGRPDAAEGALKIRIAYDRRGGNPLRRYTVTDFHLGQRPIQMECEGADAEVTESNELLIIPESPDFSVTVIGFDVNRDLYVQTLASKRPQKIGTQRETLDVE